MKWICLAAIIGLASLPLLSGCGSSPAGEKGGDKAAKAPLKPGEKAAASPPSPKGTRRAYPVRIQTVSTRPVTYELKALGSIEAQDTYRIDARVAGTIYDVKFNEGDEVSADTVLCRIAPEAYRQSALKAKAIYDQAVGTLANSKRKLASDIERMKIKLDQATLEIARRRDVKEAGAISNEEIELYQSRRDLAEVELKDAKLAAETELVVLTATIAQRDAELKIAEEDVRKATVQSPISGTIEKRLVTNQMFVTPGTPLASMVDTRTLKVIFKLAEKESAIVKEGDKVQFSVAAWNSHVFTGDVYYIGAKVENDARVVLVYARVTQDVKKLKPGFFASVKLITEQKQNSIVIPVTAVQPTERGFVAFVINGEKAERRFLTLGLAVNDNDVEVLSGLKAGEILVIEGANALQDGLPVRVIESSNAFTDKPKEVSVQSDKPAAR